MQKFNLKQWRDDDDEDRRVADRNAVQAWVEGKMTEISSAYGAKG